MVNFCTKIQIFFSPLQSTLRIRDFDGVVGFKILRQLVNNICCLSNLATFYFLSNAIATKISEKVTS